jgi:aerobic-type carbon monoxide dehydrogenase small subunit (CoxS/CutS family)
VQDAFVAEDALQCGFCTPGQIVSATALLERTAQPTREQIHEAMAGNLCRCGAYPKIERAILRAAGGQ